MARLERFIALLALALLLALCMPAQACAPADLKGTGTVAEVEVNLNGLAVGTWCPLDDAPTYYAVRWSTLATRPAIARAVAELRFAANPNNAIEVLAREFRSERLATMRDVWGPLEARMPATRPRVDEQRWAVAKAASNANPAGTRPTYLLRVATPEAPASVGPADDARVSEGSACDCDLARVVQGTSTYCSVLGFMSKLAVCVRR